MVLGRLHIAKFLESVFDCRQEVRLLLAFEQFQKFFMGKFPAKQQQANPVGSVPLTMKPDRHDPISPKHIGVNPLASSNSGIHSRGAGSGIEFGLSSPSAQNGFDSDQHSVKVGQRVESNPLWAEGGLTAEDVTNTSSLLPYGSGAGVDGTFAAMTVLDRGEQMLVQQFFDEPKRWSKDAPWTPCDLAEIEQSLFDFPMICARVSSMQDLDPLPEFPKMLVDLVQYDYLPLVTKCFSLMVRHFSQRAVRTARTISS